MTVFYKLPFLQRVRIATQTAVIARGFLYVCHSVTFRCFVQTNEDTVRSCSFQRQVGKSF